MPSSFNLAFVPSDNVGGDGRRDPDLAEAASITRSIDYIRAIRAQLPDEFPGSMFYFQTADIVSQVLNFGLSAPIDVQIQDVELRRAPTALGQQAAASACSSIPGVADAHIVQVLNYPDAAGRRRPAARGAS